MNELLARLRPTTPELVDAGFAGALAVLALWSFRSSYGGVQFFVVGVIAAGLGVVVSHVALRFSLGAVPTLLAWLFVYVLVGGVLANPGLATAGFLPSVDTVTAAIRTPVRGWKELLTTVPPVGTTGDLMLLPVFSGLCGAGASYVLARRLAWTAVAVVPPVMVLSLGILCGVETPVSVLLHGAVFGGVAVMWGSVRSRRQRTEIENRAARQRRSLSAVGFVAVAALVGLVAGPSLPMVQARDRMVWRDAFDPPFDPAEFASPLGYYREFVKELDDVPMFEVTGLPDGTPIRMATLDTYDGIVWKVSGGARALPGSAGYFQRVGTDVTPDYETTRADVEFTVPVGTGYDEVWLPTVGEVRSAEFLGASGRELADGYRYNPVTDTAAMLADLSPGDGFRLSVDVPVSIDDLPPDARFAEAVADPPQVDGSITGIGSGTVEDIEGIERVRILTDFLREVGYYSDAEEADGQALVPPGHGVGRLKQFADATVLVGNAEQYAATLGLILTNSGIPARVVMGFVPEEYDPDGTVTVHGRDAEAWVEFLVDDVGWVATFPTPDRNKTSIEPDNSPRPIPDRETQVPPPPPIVEPDADTDPAGESARVEEQREPPPEPPADDDGSGIGWIAIAVLLAVGLPLLVVGSVVGGIVFAKRRRRRRRRETGRGDERIANGWRELVDHSVDLGHDAPTQLTRRELAASLGVSGASALAERADLAVFGGVEVDDLEVARYWSDVDEAQRELDADLGPSERLRAAVNLESFRRARARRGRSRV